MIETADEFIRLVESDDPAERRKAAWEEADLGVWMILAKDHPEMRFLDSEQPHHASRSHAGFGVR